MVKLGGSVAGRTEPGGGSWKGLDEPRGLRRSHSDLLGLEPHPAVALGLGRDALQRKPKTAQGFQSDILTFLASSGIRQLAPGGKARAFADNRRRQIGRASCR